jgi:hypothetical protein
MAELSELNPYFAQIGRRLESLEAQVALLSATAGVAYAPTTSPVPPEIIELARSGKTLEAMRQYRALTGASMGMRALPSWVCSALRHRSFEAAIAAQERAPHVGDHRILQVTSAGDPAIADAHRIGPQLPTLSDPFDRRGVRVRV